MAGTTKTAVVPVPPWPDTPLGSDPGQNPDPALVASLCQGVLQPGMQITQEKSFEVIEALGEGGMGRVYKIYDASMDRYLALKVLKPDVPESERLRFHHEAVIAAHFSHPNLVHILEVGQTQDLQWMVMEYLRGSDLAAMLRRHQRMKIDLLADIVGQVLEALRYIHQRGIVHCDIKPENIFVSRDRFDRSLVMTKLIDFGIATHLGESPGGERYIVGDPRYMPPERTRADESFDTRADLYALGVTFYEALTGVHPLVLDEDIDARALLARQRKWNFEPPSRRLPDAIPEPLAAAYDNFVARACAKRPELRFPDAAAMAEDLEALRDLATELGSSDPGAMAEKDVA